MDTIKKEYIKFKGKFSKQFFPKNNKKYQYGDFAIIAFEVEPENILQGNPNIHPRWHTITVKGDKFSYINNSDNFFTVLCEVKEDKKFGKQNLLLMINEDINFDTTEGQKIFMLQAGITNNQITNLYQTFENPMEIIQNQDIKKLCEVKGIGEKLAKNMIKKYQENVDYSEAYIELVNYGMSANLIKKLVDLYGNPKNLIKEINNNPYILTNIDGMGFKKVDKIALKSGVEKLSLNRLIAYIKYVLNKGANQGYSWICSQVLVDKIYEELDNFPIEDIVHAVKILKTNKILWNGDTGRVALQKYYDLENNIKNEIVRIKNGENKFKFEGWEQRVEQAEKIQGWKYGKQQKQGIQMILKEQVSVITGKGGTGKTSTALGAINALGDINFVQTTLSGKASARMSEATGYDAYTIHRLLGFEPHTIERENGQKEFTMFHYNKYNKLNVDVVLIDEFAMIGGKLFYDLLQSIPTGSKIVLLGDPSQLPAIGSLNIGSDLTKSITIPTTILTEIHRQALKSAIITESLKISEGKQIIDSNFVGHEIRGELQDLELDIIDNSIKTSKKVIEYFKRDIQICKDIHEVQIIVPMKIKGKTSVYALNNLIQPLYNPQNLNKKEVFLPLNKDKGYTLRVGDKIINTINNYKIALVQQNVNKQWEYIINPITEEVEKIPVFNGFIGEIIDIIEDNLIIYIPQIKQYVEIDSSHWKDSKAIHLAYALTTHKVQGSQYKRVICAFDYSHYIMLNRELGYTAITRAIKHCTIIAENKALRYMTTKTAVEDKQTFLQELLDNN